jgi:tetratricopeptide (TPR) repeat protein
MVGILLQMAGRRTEAKARYQRALAVDSRAAVAANNLAWLQLEDGDNLDVALHLAQTARARLPESPAVSDTLGAIYDRKGLHAHAIDAFKHSVQRAPGNAVYHYRLGMTYVKRGDAERAREALRKALSLDPRFDGADEARAALASLG